jgi:protein-disulfide isomerase
MFLLRVSLRRLAVACACGCALVALGCQREPSTDSRLARLEARLAKVTEVLDKALPPPEPDPRAVYSVPIGAQDPIEGPADAKLTLVEGYEFACPYCFAAQPLLEALRQKHPDELRVVSKYYLIHGEPAVPAGLAACAANQQGKFALMKRAMWNKIFTVDPASGKPELAATELTAEALLLTAAEAGLDMTRLRQDMQSQDCQRWVRAGGDELEPLGARGTPAFYLNGRALAELDLTSAEALIQEELAKANRAIAAGVRSADYYRVAVVQGGLPRVKGRFEEEPASDSRAKGR